ncbi:MAG: fibronectin type III domain-containing protein, partial [Treponema sp.]|nr:fibronectin type III domain-containing protein [Treponema sp.]
MKKHPALVLTAVFVALLLACPNPGGGDDSNDTGDDDKDQPQGGKTLVYFVNDNDFSVTIYTDSSRLVKFADVGVKDESEPVETEPNPNAIFYPSYHILIDDQEFPYNHNGVPARIDAEKTTKVLIPLLSELDPAELAKPVATGVYIKIQNASAFPLVLRRGTSEEIPQGASSSILNGGETARYMVNGGPVSNYAFMKNTVTPIAFPADLTNFLAGHLYSLKFDGNALVLLADKPITIAQALEILPPETVSARSLANGHISLAWDKVGTETGYGIYRSGSATGTYARIGTADGVSYTDAAVTIGATYYYRISSVKQNVESDKSTTVVSARAEISSLASPGGLSVTGRTETSISLSWQPAPDATGYKVYRGLSSNTVTDYVTETASTSYTVTGLTENTSYYFAVSAVNENGESLPSTAVQGTTPETALAAPAGLTVTAQTQTSLTLSWQAVSGAEGYRVSRSASSGGSFNPIQTTASTSYTDNAGLTAGATYYYRVTAYKGQVESSP